MKVNFNLFRTNTESYSLSDMLIIHLVLLIIGEILIAIIFPGKVLYNSGFLIGVLLSGITFLNLLANINVALRGNWKWAAAFSIILYLFRLFLVLGLASLVYFTGIGNVFAVLGGYIVLKLSVLLQPFIKKLR